jgi:aldose 1-epimerase
MSSIRRAIVPVLALALGTACSKGSPQMAPPPAPPTLASYGRTAEGQAIDITTLRNRHGLEVRAITYGATIVSIRTPDRARAFDDVVLGYDDPESYVRNGPFFGVVVGRYGNRIAKGRFTLDGRTYSLAINNAPNHLHGGVKGWDKAVWKGEPFQDVRGSGIVFSHTSPDGDEGYPGSVRAAVTYTLTDADELRIDYEATTDAPTVINLTQHTYFNLAGKKAADVLGHNVMIAADRYTPVDAGLIPTGELAPVTGTPFDFRQPTAIGARIDQPDPQLVLGHGYDHNFVVNRGGDGLVPAARVVDPTSGRTLEVRTTEPGVQFYTANFLDGVKGRAGVTYGRHAGFCLETQHFPDSPNHPAFPSTVLWPGQTYRTTTVFAFGVE